MLDSKKHIRNKKIAVTVVTVLILIFIIVENVLCIINAEKITNWLCGSNVTVEKDDEALTVGDNLVGEIQKEGTVLLKNENNALPLEETVRNLNVFGWASSADGFLMRSMGSNSVPIASDKRITLGDALKTEFTLNAELEALYSSYYKSLYNEKYYQIVEPSASVYTDEVIAAAKNFSSVALVVIGRIGGEGMMTLDGKTSEIPSYQEKAVSGARDETRTYAQISVEEEQMLNIVCDNFERVIVLINTCSNMHLGFLEDNRVDAALYVGITGQSGAAVIPDILRGKVNPSGRLADTYVYEPHFDPVWANRERWNSESANSEDSIVYAEDIYFGYKWYETADNEDFFNGESNEYGDDYDAVVQYPFGYGLSYTTFSQSVESVSVADGHSLDKDSVVEVSVRVTNTGGAAGKDVVQLYGSPVYESGKIEKAHVSLIGFAKTELLNPKESQILKISFSAYQLASYDAYDLNNNGFATYELDEGRYTVKLMKNAHEKADTDNAEINYEIAETLVFSNDPETGKEVKNRFTGEAAYAGLSIDGLTVGVDGYMTRSDFKRSFPTQRTKKLTSENTELDEAARDRIRTANRYIDRSREATAMPTTGEEGFLRMVLTDEHLFPSIGQLKGETPANLVYNDVLLTDLAKDYDSSFWTTLLNQMTLAEYKKTVECAGYGTIAIESVGKPLGTDLDGPAGFNLHNISTANETKWTTYPSETLIACSWNREICFLMGLAMGLEASKSGIDGWYAPGVNLHRTQYNGRNAEYYSEDGFLSGKMAAEVIRGAKVNGLNCYLKHFAVSEEGVNPVALNTVLTEQNLRENYLKPFEIAVKEGGANAIMAAFNRVGFTWAGASRALNCDILRVEWGFCGAVITDWSQGSVYMNTVQGIRGGTDLWLNPYSVNDAPLDINSTADMTYARNACKNLLYMIADTYYFSLTYDAELDDTYKADNAIIIGTPVFPWWIILLVAIDVVSVALLAHNMYKTFKSSPDKV